MFCQKGKELFATPCDTALFRSRKETALDGIRKDTFLRRKDREYLLDFVGNLPDDNTHCLHGDFQPGNLILSEGTYYWIDLARFAWGDPLFDVGHLYCVCNVFSRTKQAREVFHLTEEQLHTFWDAFAKAYTGHEDHTDFDREAARYAAADIAMRSVYTNLRFVEKLFFRMLVRDTLKTALK